MENNEKGFVDYCNGYTLEEIASKRNVALSTVKTWTQRGIDGVKWNVLREQCRGEDGEIDFKKVREHVGGKGNLFPVVAVNRSGRFPQQYSKKLEEDKELVKGTLKEVLRFYDYEPVDTDQAIEIRINEYLGYCVEEGVIPTVEGMANAIGCHPRTLLKWEAKTGTVRGQIVKRAKLCIQDFDARLAMRGEIDKTTYIFRAKNFYDMKDEIEQIITRNDPLGERKSADAIADRLDSLPQEDDVELPVIDVEIKEI